MSSLLKLKTPIREQLVQVSDEEAFPVRGLSPYHVVGLYFRHTGELSALVERLATTYTANGGEFKATDTAAIVLDLAKEAPMILAELITLASGGDPANEDDWSLAVEIAGALPFPVQADALEKVMDLTFTSDMPPGKFVRLVARAIQSATPSRPSI